MEATTLSRKRIFHGKRWNAWHSVRHGARRQVAPHANFVDFGGNRQSPEAQRNGTTAHYRQKTHHLSVVSRRIARLKKKWGKSSLVREVQSAKRLSQWRSGCFAFGKGKVRGSTSLSRAAPVAGASLEALCQVLGHCSALGWGERSVVIAHLSLTWLVTAPFLEALGHCSALGARTGRALQDCFALGR